MTFVKSHIIAWDLENCTTPRNVPIEDILIRIIETCVFYNNNYHSSNEDKTEVFIQIYGEQKCWPNSLFQHIEWDSNIKHSSLVNAGMDHQQQKEIAGNIIDLSSFKLLNQFTEECNLSLNVFSNVFNQNIDRKSDQSDKKMLVDIMSLVYEEIMKNININLCLISSDSDFLHMIRVLSSKKQVYSILIHGRTTNSTLKEAFNVTHEWYNISRGMEDEGELKVDESWENKLIECVDDLLGEGIKISENFIRAHMGMDKNIKQWKLFTQQDYYHSIVEKAMIEQKKFQYFDPEDISFDHFSVKEIIHIYAVILKKRGLKKRGKYQLSVCLCEEYNNTSESKKMTLGKIMEFVHLCISKEWFEYTGKYCIIKETIKNEFPYEEVFNTQNEQSTLSTNYRPKDPFIHKECHQYNPEPQEIGLFHSKSALQYYLQKYFKKKPVYETLRSGPDHLSLFTTNVQVWLPQGGYFFAKGESVQKKKSEKMAAMNACNELISVHLKKYRFPEKYSTTSL